MNVKSMLIAGVMVCRAIWVPISLGAEELSKEEVLGKVAAAEARHTAQMARCRPLLEAYIQVARSGENAQAEVVSDSYFIGRLDLSRGTGFDAFVPDRRSGSVELLKKFYKMRLLPSGFAQMTIIDQTFDASHYDFEYIRGEFLGEVRCLVFDVKPKEGAPEGSFIGRIWVEDRDFNIVRFSGTYTSRKALRYLHFNTYRQQAAPGLWIPSVIYVEETLGPDRKGASTTIKGQVNLWGYDAAIPAGTDAFTVIRIETPEPARDQIDLEVSRAEALRAWQRQAEDNAIRRLEKAGLLGQSGDVEKVLGTVINNLAVTNGLELDEPVTARVLLTTPLESFTIGRTIVLSRGLIDVLPNEASLAAVVARELAEIVLGGHMRTKYAFSDQTMFSDGAILKEFEFRRSAEQDQQANAKALELLENSPYKGDLPGVARFLAALASKAGGMPNLFRPQLGNPLAENGNVLLVPGLLEKAPPRQLETEAAAAALPLASRVRVDPWDGRTTLLKPKVLSQVSPGEGMPFEVTPVLVQLQRREDDISGAGH